MCVAEHEGVHALHRCTEALSWFGRLPGDIRVERPGMRVYVPITSMLLISVVISLILAFIRRFR